MSSELPAPSPKRLLIIDDQPEFLQILLRQLRRAGYDATVCASVEEAHRALAGGQYHGALIDIYFGLEPSGIDLVASIRRHPRTASLPVVSMSGSGTHDLQQALNAGADFALEKPFIAPELLDALARAEAMHGDGPSRDSNKASGA